MGPAPPRRIGCGRAAEPALRADGTAITAVPHRVNGRDHPGPPAVNVQPMSCDHAPAVHRTVDLPAPLDAVWEAIVAGDWLGTDVEIDARPGGALRVDTRVGVVEAAEPGRSLSFWWTTPDRDEPASRVDVEIQRVGDITRLWVREVQLDLDVRAMLRAPSALARA